MKFSVGFLLPAFYHIQDYACILINSHSLYRLFIIEKRVITGREMLWLSFT